MMTAFSSVVQPNTARITRWFQSLARCLRILAETGLNQATQPNTIIQFDCPGHCDEHHRPEIELRSHFRGANELAPLIYFADRQPRRIASHFLDLYQVFTYSPYMHTITQSCTKAKMIAAHCTHTITASGSFAIFTPDAAKQEMIVIAEWQKAGYITPGRKGNDRRDTS